VLLSVGEMGLIPVHQELLLDPFVVLVMLRNTLKLPHTEGFSFMASSAFDKLTRFLIVDGSSKATGITSFNALNQVGS